MVIGKNCYIVLLNPQNYGSERMLTFHKEQPEEAAVKLTNALERFSD